MQTTSHILMIRPSHFDFNKETAVNNSFQINTGDHLVPEKALNEFDQFVKHKLKARYYIRYADDFVFLSQTKWFLRFVVDATPTK